MGASGRPMIEARIADVPAAQAPPAAANPDDAGEPAYLAAVDRLDEITGVGRHAAQVIIAEVGLSMAIFPPPRTWCPGPSSHRAPTSPAPRLAQVRPARATPTSRACSVRPPHQPGAAASSRPSSPSPAPSSSSSGTYSPTPPGATAILVPSSSTTGSGPNAARSTTSANSKHSATPSPSPRSLTTSPGDSSFSDQATGSCVASDGRWRRVGILMSLTVCRARSFCSSSAELLDHGVCDGLGTAGVLPRDQLAVLDDVGVKRLVGQGVLSTALLQVVLQAERDGLAALSDLLFGPRETSDILVLDQVVAVTEPDVEQPGRSVADRGDDLAGLVEPGDQARELLALGKVEHHTVPTGQVDRVVVGDVDVGHGHGVL